jgi:hypothetical protein
VPKLPTGTEARPTKGSTGFTPKGVVRKEVKKPKSNKKNRENPAVVSREILVSKITHFVASIEYQKCQI